MINNVIFAVSAETLNLVSTILTISFFVIVGLCVLGALFHMGKGILRNTYRVVWNLVMILIGALFTGLIAKSIGGIDISSIGSFTFQGSTINPTTIYETLENIVLAFGGNDDTTLIYIAVHEPETLEMIQAIVNIALCYVVFFVWMLLVITVFRFIGWLIWKLFLGGIIERHNKKLQEEGKKVKKHRLAGLAIGFVNAALVWFMLLTPLTSIVNTTAAACKNREASEGDDEMYSDILSYTEAYNNSVFGTIGTMTAGADGVTIDAQIMDTITSQNYEGEKISLNNELTNYISIGLDLAQAGILSGEGGLDYSKLLTKDFISTLLSSLGDSGLFTTVLKLAGNIAVKYGAVKGFLDDTKIDLSDVSWKDEIENINTIYQAVYDAGLVDSFTDKTAALRIPVDKDTEADKIVSMRKIFTSFDNSKVLSAVLPSVLYTMANKTDSDGNATGLGTFLSSSWETYANISWGSELSLIYDFAVNLEEKAELDINELITTSSTKEPTIEEAARFGKEERRLTYGMKDRHILYESEPDTSTEKTEEDKSFIDKLLEKADYIIPLITGESDGEYEAGETCLLDSNLIYNSFDKLIGKCTSLITSNETYGSSIEQEKLDEIVDSLNTKALIKNEIKSVLKAGKSLLVDGNLMNGLNLDSDEQKASIKAATSYIDDSKLFSYMIPCVLKSMASSITFGDDFGFGGSDLNFDNIKIGSELSSLIDSYSSLKGFTSIDDVNTDDLKDVLEKLATSGIFNKVNGEVTFDEVTSKRTSLSAYEKLIKYILKLTTLDTYLVASGATEEEKEAKVIDNIIAIENNLVVETDSTNEWTDSEVENLVNVFKAFKDLNIDSLGSDNMSSLDSTKLNALLKDVNNSKLLTGSMGRLFETAFSAISIADLCSTTPDYYLSNQDMTTQEKKLAYDSEIDLMTDMLDSLKKSDNTMLDFSSGDRNTISNFIKDGKSLSTIIYGLDTSKILSGNNGAIITNVFSKVGADAYICSDETTSAYGGTTEQKIATINSLFAKSDFQTALDAETNKSVEGSALDQLILALANIEEVDLGEATSSSAGGLIDTIKYCVGSDGTNRAYLASEMMAGVLQNLFDTLDSTLSANHKWRANNYELLTHESANAINDALIAKDKYTTLATDRHNTTYQNDFVSAMEKLDTYGSTSATGTMLNDLLYKVFLEKYQYNGISLNTLVADQPTWKAKAEKIVSIMNV